MKTVAGIDLVPVPGGSFRMGDGFGDGFQNELPVHEVAVDDFHLGRFLVTQVQWEAAMGANPSTFALGPDHPVETVSWFDVQDFLAALNAKAEGTFRLPTEAEWEYAARSGGKDEYLAGLADPDLAPEYAWYDDTAGKQTQPVGKLKPNGLGLHDMSGNVYEFVADVFAHDAYAHHAPRNPVHRGIGEDRTIRGGSWRSYKVLCRCSDRSNHGPTYKDSYVGVRVAWSPAP